MGSNCSCCEGLSSEWIKKSIDNPLISTHIGSGTFGDVYQIDDLAVKQFKKNVGVEFIIHEIANLKLTNRTQAKINKIVFAHKILLDATDYKVYILMDCHEQTLEDWLRERRGSSEGLEKKCNKFARDITKALEWLHGLGIAHRDVKTDNILVSGEDAVLGDLGQARFLGRQEFPECTGRVVSFWFRAPELLFRGVERRVNSNAGLVKYDARIDIWALGVIMFQMALGQHPFAGKKEKDTFLKIFKWLGTPDDSVLESMGVTPGEVPGYLPKDLSLAFWKMPSLLEPARRCLRVDPKERPWAPQVFSPVVVWRPEDVIQRNVALMEPSEIDPDRINMNSRSDALDYILGQLFKVNLLNASTFAYLATLYDLYCSKKEVPQGKHRGVALACAIIAINMIERVSLQSYISKITNAPLRYLLEMVIYVIKTINCNLHLITFVEALGDTKINGYLLCICVAIVFNRQYLEYPLEDLAKVALEIYEGEKEEALSPEATEISNQILTLAEDSKNYALLIDYFKIEDNIKSL